jgi:hypothetical protein
MALALSLQRSLGLVGEVCLCGMASGSAVCSTFSRVAEKSAPESPVRVPSVPTTETDILPQLSLLRPLARARVGIVAAPLQSVPAALDRLSSCG